MKTRILIGLVALFTAFTASAQYTGTGGLKLDVPYVPTRQETVDAMLKLANVGPNEIHYDLGSGDGRIVVTAARDFKIKKGVGVDLDPTRIAEANANAKAAGVTDRVTFIQGDLFQLDFKDATVLTMYLLPEVNLKLRPKILDELKPGTRVVSHAFNMGDWQPDVSRVVEGSGNNIYYWIVPAKVAGTWQWQQGNETYNVTLNQTYQNTTGSLAVAGAQGVAIDKGLISGGNITFEARVSRNGTQETLRFSGKVTGNTIDATIDVGGKSNKVTAKKV